MNKYRTVYPVFEDIIITIIVLINQRMIFKKISNNEIVFLDKIKDRLEVLLEKFEHKPAISNVNIESIVNECYKLDPSMHGMVIKIEFVENPDSSRFGCKTLNIRK